MQSSNSLVYSFTVFCLITYARSVNFSIRCETSVCENNFSRVITWSTWPIQKVPTCSCHNHFDDLKMEMKQSNVYSLCFSILHWAPDDKHSLYYSNKWLNHLLACHPLNPWFCWNSEKAEHFKLLESDILPAKSCTSVSQRTAARTPFTTSAKKAFFTWSRIVQQSYVNFVT